jgi:hypothetical protein
MIRTVTKTCIAMMLSAAFFISGLQPVLAADPRACACLGKSLDVRWEDATAVFTGTVQEIASPKNFPKKERTDPPIIVTLSVDKAYKGTEGKETFTLYTSLTQYTCTGYPFEKGKQYLVFAYQRQKDHADPSSFYHFHTGTYDVGGLCGGTKELESAAEDLQALQSKVDSAP